MLRNDDRQQQVAASDRAASTGRTWRGVTGRRRIRRALSRYRRFIAAGVTISFLLLVVWVGLRVHTAYGEYKSVNEQIGTLKDRAHGDLAALSSDDMTLLAADLAVMQSHLERLDAATALPIGGGLIVHLPWIGPRYTATHALLQLGEVITDAAQPVLAVVEETLAAFNSTGINSPAQPDAPTWLDVLAVHQSELDTLATRFTRAKAIRADIDDRVLPGRVRAQLATLDRILNRFDAEMLTADLPALRAALGGDRPMRYLILLQNPAEMRPTGGFPGTMALVTLSRGQVQFHETFDAHTLTDAYIAQRRTKLPEPWPIEQYIPQNGFLLHDATWWPDFPRSATQMMAMYAETNWPPIDGIIALEPTVIRDLLGATGPLTIALNGDSVLITPDNFYQQIELRQRQLVTGGQPDIYYKDLVGIIGTAMIAHLQTISHAALLPTAKNLIAAANRRDLQVYAANPNVERVLDAHRWTGRLIPDPAVPTFAVTSANLVSNKASTRMQPHVHLTFAAPTDGPQRATLTIDLEHTGSFDDSPYFAGFQRWWVEVLLPVGSTRLASSPDPLPDPDAPNGGSYLIEIFPQQVGHITVDFSLPAGADHFLFRRQPGITPIALTVADSGCPAPVPVSLTADLTVAREQRCP